MKTNLELNISDNGIWLNYWDNEHGNDICGKLKGDAGIDVDGLLLTYNEFFQRVIERGMR